MGRRNSKKPLSSLSKKRSAQRLQLPSKAFANSLAFRPPEVPSVPAPTNSVKAVKKKGGSRLWMRLDSSSRSEVVELDKSAIIKCAGIPPRDLRILGPIFSNSSNILAREKAMVINLEFIKAIVTAEEVLVLDPLCHEVIPFIDLLRHQLPFKNPLKSHEPDHAEMQNKDKSATERQFQKANELPENEHELPFEFQVLEIALEVVCTFLDSNVANLEKEAYPVLDELALKVSSKNLERVRSLKSNLTRLLARVQKVRDEIEHLLDDNEDMADLYLTRKQIQNRQVEALITSAASNGPILSRQESVSIISNIYADENDVEDLEMLLEAYFVQLDGIRNKILSVREYIDDTEDYVNIQLDNHRNELIQLQLILTMASFAIAVNTYIVGAFAMNIPSQLYEIENIFTPFVGGTSSGCAVIFLVLLVYARWKKLLGP